MKKLLLVSLLFAGFTCNEKINAASIWPQNNDDTWYPNSKKDYLLGEYDSRGLNLNCSSLVHHALLVHFIKKTEIAKKPEVQDFITTALFSAEEIQSLRSVLSYRKCGFFLFDQTQKRMLEKASSESRKDVVDFISEHRFSEKDFSE